MRRESNMEETTSRGFSRRRLLQMGGGLVLAGFLEGCSTESKDISSEQAALRREQEDEKFRELIEPVTEAILSKVKTYEKTYAAKHAGATCTGKAQGATWWETEVKHGDGVLTVEYKADDVDSSEGQIVEGIQAIRYRVTERNKLISYGISRGGGAGIYRGAIPGRWFIRKEETTLGDLFTPVDSTDTFLVYDMYTAATRDHELTRALESGTKVIKGDSTSPGFLSRVEQFLSEAEND